MSSLMTKNEVSIEQVKAVPCPSGTRTWKPISHFEIIQQAKAAAKRVGLEISNERYGMAKEGNTQMFGTMDIKGHSHFNGEIELVMGLRNSIDRTLSAGVLWGNRVICCDNLMFTASESEFSSIITRKHTRFIEEDLSSRLDEGMSKFELAKEYHERLFSNLKNTAVSLYHVHDLLVKASLCGAIPNKDIPKVRNEYLSNLNYPDTQEQYDRWQPSFSEPTAFSLINAFTEVAKPYQAKNSLVSSERTIKLTKLFEKEFIS